MHEVARVMSEAIRVRYLKACSLAEMLLLVGIAQETRSTSK